MQKYIWSRPKAQRPMVQAQGPWAHGPGPRPMVQAPGPMGPHMVTLSFMIWTLMPPQIAILRENKVELMEMLRVIVVG